MCAWTILQWGVLISGSTGFRKLIDAIKAGVPGAAVKDEIAVLEARQLELLAQKRAAPPPMPRLHPNLAELYRKKASPKP